MKLIDKDALVAEIERRMDELYKILPDASEVENGAITISDAINTGKYTALESFGKFINTIEVKEVEWTEEDMKLIWTIGDDIPYMAEEDFYKEILKRFKAQKGE